MEINRVVTKSLVFVTYFFDFMKKVVVFRPGIVLKDVRSDDEMMQ